MRYFVTGGDGNTYGPVDVDTLRHWIREGRVRPETELRDEETGVNLKAGDVEALRGAWQDTGPRPQQAYPAPACQNCGRPVDYASRVCPNCGAPVSWVEQGKLMTGNGIADRVLGFVVGFFSYAVYGFGAIAALFAYFAIRPTYPVFARALMAGLLTVLVIFLGLFAVCIFSFSSMK